MQIDLLATDPPERAAALALLGPRLPLRERESPSPEPPFGDALWIHGEPPPIDGEETIALRTWLADGGRVLLTGPAVRLCGVLCDEAVLPEVERGVWPRRVDAGDGRGVMGLPRQPLFHRFPGGVLLTRARPDRPRVCAAWRAGCWPASGRVLGVERRLDRCDAGRAVLVEHRVGRGRVMSLGVPLGLSARDDETDETRARFVGDLFDYLASDHAAERSPSWPEPTAPREVAVRLVGGGAAPMVAIPSEPVASGDAFLREFDRGALSDDAFFQLVGRDGQAVYGRLCAGVDEVWGWSFRTFRALGLSVARDGGDAAPLAAGVESAWVHPDEIGWRWRDRDAALDVRLCRAADGDGFAFAMRAAGAPLRVEVTAQVDLRPSDPYPAELVAAIAVGTARAGASTTFGEGLIGGRCALVLDRKPVRAWIRDASSPAAGGAVVEVGRAIRVDAGDEAVVSFGGRLPAWEEEGAVPRAPAAPAEFAGRVELATGVVDVDRALASAVARAADFVVPLDARNGGLVAGHPRGACARFVARDALWCDRTWLPLGERALARADLALCTRFQDPSGRVHSDVTPLGVVRTEGGDATPMFVDAVARYLAWTGDRAFVEELWPAVGRALAWVEGAGDPGDVLVARAFAAGAAVAAALGDEERAAALAARAVDAREQTIARGVGGARDAALAWALGFGEEGGEAAALRPLATLAEQWTPRLAGIAALADFRWGRPDAAWLRLRTQLRGVEELAERSATGVTAGIGAVVEGVIGLRLHDGQLALEPTLPGALDRITFGNVAFRETSLAGEVSREGDGRDVVVRLQVEGEPLELDVAPFVPAPARVDGAVQDGKAVEVHEEPVGDGVRVRARVKLAPGSTELRFRVVPDVVLAIDATPVEPGRPSAGLRFLGRRVAEDGASAAFDFECRSEIALPIRAPGRPIAGVEGAELIDGTLRIPAPAGDRPVTVTVRW